MMNKVTIGVTASLLSVFALAAWQLNARDKGPGDLSMPVGDVYFDSSAATEERIRALEIAVGEERNARQLLEEELRVILDELERISVDSEQVEQDRVASSQDFRDAQQFRETFQRRRDDRFSTRGRMQSLTDAGFAPDRAAMIVQREEELQLEVMQAMFEARRLGTPVSAASINTNQVAMLRAELGDSDYEMYLQATNRPTSVGVSNVLGSSPAQNAGLQVGDRITSYDGQRVFNVLDLNAQTIRGTPGQNVIVDIERDGIPMQIVLPRGPLGIMSGRR